MAVNHQVAYSVKGRVHYDFKMAWGPWLIHHCTYTHPWVLSKSYSHYHPWILSESYSHVTVKAKEAVNDE